MLNMKHSEIAPKQQENPAVVLIDIREAFELDIYGPLEGATHIPMGQMFIKAAKDELPKDTEMIVYCASGLRAGIVARELSEREYKISSVDEPLTARN